MPQTQLVAARRPVYPVDFSWPAGSIEGAGSVPELSAWDPNRVQIMNGTQAPDLAVSAGSSGGTGTNVNYGVAGGLLMANLSTTGARLVQFFNHPSMGWMYQLQSFRSSGSVSSPHVVVQWLRVWHTWPDPGTIYTDDGTGIGMVAFEGSGLTADDLPGGAQPNKLMCGVCGRNEGGQQAYQWRSFDPAGATIEAVDVPFGPGPQSAQGHALNTFDLVVRSPRKPDPASSMDATFSLHVNDPTGQSPLLTRDVARAPAGTQIPAPSEYTPTSLAGISPWGFVWCVADLSPASARAQRWRYRLRGGRYLPDGSELPLS